MRLYRNGPFHVAVNSTGAIHVKGGDSLSKYSAAMFNNFRHIGDFARPDHHGGIRAIANVNLIYAGETLYHVPTYEKANHKSMVAAHAGEKPSTAHGNQVGGNGQPGHSSPPPRSSAVTEQQVVELLKKDFNLRGDHMPALSKLAKIVGLSDNAVALADYASLLKEGGVLSRVGEGLAVLSCVLGTWDNAMDMLNAREIGQRIYGMRAIAYATVAWAFGDSMPTGSATMLRRWRQWDPAEIPLLEMTWQKVTAQTVANLQSRANKLKLPYQRYREHIRQAGDGNRKTLCRLIFEKLEDRLNPAVFPFPQWLFRDGVKVGILDQWKASYSVLYPD
jgi:hypothetical protein